MIFRHVSMFMGGLSLFVFGQRVLELSLSEVAAAVVSYYRALVYPIADFCAPALRGLFGLISFELPDWWREFAVLWVFACLSLARAALQIEAEEDSKNPAVAALLAAPLGVLLAVGFAFLAALWWPIAWLVFGVAALMIVFAGVSHFTRDPEAREAALFFVYFVGGLAWAVVLFVVNALAP